MARRDSFIVVGANPPWVYGLAAALAESGHRVSAIAPYDLLNYYKRRPRWPRPLALNNLERRFWTYPPGYVGRYQHLFTPILRRRLSATVSRLLKESAAHPWIIVAFPWFQHFVDTVPDDRLIYFHFDDYTLYNTARSSLTLQQQDKLVQRSALTLCASRQQRNFLLRRNPDCSPRLKHFPLGVFPDLINNTPTAPRTKVVGYIGNLSDRVDWQLVNDVCTRMPDVTFCFCGGLDAPSAVPAETSWRQLRETVLSAPNVRYVGQVPQAEINRHYNTFAVNWIPYLETHPFNIACCPTKIMDGLASGRPMMSTRIPECQLYPDWIHLASTPAETVQTLDSLFDFTSDNAYQHQMLDQLEYVRSGQTWDCRARSLCQYLAELTPSA